MSKSTDSTRKPPWSRVALIASFLLIPAILIVTEWSWGEVRSEVQFKASGSCSFTASRHYKPDEPDAKLIVDRSTDLQGTWKSKILPLREADENTLHVVGPDDCPVSCVVIVNGEEKSPKKGTGGVRCDWPVQAD